MGKTITRSDIFNYLKNGGKLIEKLALKFYGESLNQTGEQAFSEGIEIGIENTFAALYEANVRDEKILHVACECWGINRREAEERLIFEKQQASIRSLKQFLKLQGYSATDINDYIRDHSATIKIRHDKDLWRLKDNPEKLMKAIEAKK